MLLIVYTLEHFLLTKTSYEIQANLLVPKSTFLSPIPLVSIQFSLLINLGITYFPPIAKIINPIIARNTDISFISFMIIFSILWVYLFFYFCKYTSLLSILLYHKHIYHLYIYEFHFQSLQLPHTYTYMLSGVFHCLSYQ